MNLKLSSIAYGLIILIAGGWLLITGSTIILPILYAILLSIILNPIDRFFLRKFKNHTISIICTFLTILLPLGLIIYAISIQLGNIIETLPDVTTSLDLTISKLSNDLTNMFPFLRSNRPLFTLDTLKNSADGPLKIVQNGLISSTSGLFSMVLALIYTVFFMYYRKSFKNFLVFQFEKSSRPEIKVTINRIKETVQSYVGGLGLVIVILAVLNTIGLWIIGIDYALFWGILAGLLAVIPYIGTLLGGLLPLMYAMATVDSTWQPMAVAIYYFIIQQIEGNIITPKVVGKQVDLNPLVSIFALVFFATIWGVGGVILALPIMSIIRIILEQFDDTKALAVLMGSQIADEAGRFKEIAAEQ